MSEQIAVLALSRKIAIAEYKFKNVSFIVYLVINGSEYIFVDEDNPTKPREIS